MQWGKFNFFGRMFTNRHGFMPKGLLCDYYWIITCSNHSGTWHEDQVTSMSPCQQRDRKGKVCYVTQVTWVQNLTFGWYWSREKLSIFIFSFFIFSCVGIRAIIKQRSSSSCRRDDFSEEKKFLENFLTNEKWVSNFIVFE